jgi:serine/threonine protein kinase
MPHGRPPLSPRPLTHDFIVIKQLTPTEGYNNGGIFKVKDRRTGKKCIEKRFNPEDVVHGEAYNEISKTAMLKHENIVEYVHAFLESHAPYRASLYVGLCNYGSLDVSEVMCSFLGFCHSDTSTGCSE